MPTDAEKVAIASDVLAALGNGDHGPALDALDESVRVRASGPLWSRRYRGVEGLLEAYRDGQRQFADASFSIDAVRADDDGSVVVAGTVSATREDGASVAAEVSGVIRFSAGKINRIYLRARRPSSE